jgi:hypothetical protein
MNKPLQGLLFREKVVEEIIQTEQDFVNDMNILITLFLNPNLAGVILSANEVERLFSNISTLIKINEGMSGQFIAIRSLLQFRAIESVSKAEGSNCVYRQVCLLCSARRHFYRCGTIRIQLECFY